MLLSTNTTAGTPFNVAGVVGKPFAPMGLFGANELLGQELLGSVGL
jgi:hypothetical protein